MDDNQMWPFEWKLQTWTEHMMAQFKVEMNYRKIPIISPGLIFIQKAFLLGFFLGELIFGGAYYWLEFCFSIYSPRAYIWGGGGGY